MAALTDIEIPSVTRIVVTADEAMDEASALKAVHWDVNGAGGADPVVVVRVQLSPSGTVATLDVEPGMRGGSTYTVTPTGVLDAATGDPATDTVEDSAPLEGRDPISNLPLPVLRATIQAIAQEVDTLGGELVSILLADFEPGDTRLLVESALGWPERGAVWVGGHRLRYGSVHPSLMRLEDVFDDDDDASVIPYGSMVTVDARDVFAN